MARPDWARSRFDAEYEATSIMEGIRGYQAEFGDLFVYYRFWPEKSQKHDVWNEAAGSGKVYHSPETLPALHVTHVEGAEQSRDEGFYVVDSLYVTCSFDQLRRIGMDKMDLSTHAYLRDRMVYDGKVFRVDNISVTGQIRERDIMVSIEGTQVKPDEMLNDPQFIEFLREEDRL